MGLGGVEGPPKKKLKQAQLNFCISTEKPSNKRKLSDSSDGLAPKLFRSDPGTPLTPKPQVVDKENVVVNSVDKTQDDVQKNLEPKIDVVVVLDDDSVDDKPKDGRTEGKAIKGAPSGENITKTDDIVSQGSKCEDKGDQKSETEPTQTKPSEEKIDTLLSTKDEAKPLEGDLIEAKVDSGSEDETELTDSEAQNDHLASLGSKDPVKPTNSESVKDQADPKLDKSADSEQGANTSVVLSSEDEQTSSPTVKTTPTRRIVATPKSSTKKAERQRQREEKLRLKKEKEEQKRKEKEEKEKKKLEESRLKEEERKRKEEERKRKEEDKRRKEEDKRRKEEERKKKEEAKEEERRKKEEEKKKKEEIKEEDRRKKEEARLAEERKENLAKAAFTKFFITEKNKLNLPKKEELEAHTEKLERSHFMPFPVKSDMRLAVQVRHTLTEEEKKALSEVLTASQPVGDTYLKELKNGKKPKTGPATWPLSDEQHDLIIVESVDDDKVDVEHEGNSKAKSKGQRAKLLQFHENRRPPYWGTWRKPSKVVGPRRPFGQEKILDYEVDSDSEWEDEEEGEDIEKEDGDSDKEEADDENVGENGYMLDNTFVPHGYLSDEEADEAEDDDSVEKQKLKLTVLKQEFDQELKSKTQRLQPRLLGCVKISNTTLEASKSIYELLMRLRCKWDNEEPIDVTSPAVVECSPSPSVSNTKFPSSMVEQLAKLIHGNRSSMKALISEFISSCDKDTQLSAVSKRAVFLKVKEIAAKTYSSGSGRLVWAVNPDLCAEFGLEPIVDPPKIAPVVSPIVEPPKPKDSPLASFLKKTPQRPIKRIATTLVPRDGPSGPSSRGHEAVHVDTPRPKFVSQGGNCASNTIKPIRRVATTLLSSVAAPVRNKTFNVGEIDKPGQFPISSQHRTDCTVGEMVDLTDSNDGITPLPDEVDQPVPQVLAACKLSPVLSKSPTPVAGTCDLSVDPIDSRDAGSPTRAKATDDSIAVGSLDPAPSSADSLSGTVEPMNTGSPMAASDTGFPASAAQTGQMPCPAITDLANENPTVTESSPMETDDSPEPLNEVKPPTIPSDSKPLMDLCDAEPSAITDAKPISIAEAKPSTVLNATQPPAVSSDAKPSTTTDTELSDISSDAKPSPSTDTEPPTVPSEAKPPASTDAEPPAVSSEAKPLTIAEDKPPTISVAAKPSATNDAEPPAISSDAKPLTAASAQSPVRASKPPIAPSNAPEGPKTIPSTPTPVRKRVPLVTLSKSVSKTKSPGQNLSIADMFCRKSAKNVAPSKPVPVESPSVVDLSVDSD